MTRRLGLAGRLAAVAFGCAAAAGCGGDPRPVPDPAAGLPKASPEIVWTQAAPCPQARFESSGVVVGDELWVLGGFTSSSLLVTQRVDIYRPATDSWRAGPDLPGAQTHMGVVTPGAGDVVVVGGFQGAFVGGRKPPVATEVWRWSAGAATWGAGPALPAARAAFGWALLGTDLHVAGGLGPDGNTDTDGHLTWDVAGTPAWRTVAPLPLARNHGGSTAVGGRFYVIAGRHGWDEVSGDVSDVDVFDPATGAWTAGAPIPGARSEIGASTTTLSDGRILVVGGSLPGIRPSANVLVYDPAADAWSAFTALPAPRKGAVAQQIGDRIVVTTGSPTSVDPTDTTFVGCCL